MSEDRSGTERRAGSANRSGRNLTNRGSLTPPAAMTCFAKARRMIFSSGAYAREIVSSTGSVHVCSSHLIGRKLVAALWPARRRRNQSYLG